MHSGRRTVKTETFHLITCLKLSFFPVGSKQLFTAPSIVFQLLVISPLEALDSKLLFPTLLLCLSCCSLELDHLNGATALLTLPWEAVPACLSLLCSSQSCQRRLLLLAVISRVV